MKKEGKDYGCVVIILCLVISFVLFGWLSEYIGELAYPLVVISGLGLAKLTEPIWSKKDNDK